ncbi:hypothetical protein FGK63_07840 [Ruegeria sediminis]|uniref:Aminoglycoside phosphotransferase domain-containing protein n=1 Tax=Ruegeria sediminis TaxID=2583820 RepID=A0ABY2X1B4_9RHOB|nr:bifunctional aminoglycoside phosphotransferase/ATP-binding protein [Ruegeria sediminis]TMV09023.1 hypothetical protein FGK63_07840 [Ruegeria sediminis]
MNTEGSGTLQNPENSPEHQAVIAFLADPATHDGQQVQRVDTHISHIFLTDTEAFKLKRPIRTNFLDFSTLNRREAACRREIEVNQTVAAQIYRDVLPIVRRERRLQLGGQGDPVDWVVRMRRFDRAGEFDRLAERGELGVQLAEALADTVAKMHLGAPVAPEFGGAARVKATIEQISEAIETSPAAADLKDPLTDWRSRAQSELDKRTAQLNARRRHGYVRRCHGDLHLGNICLIDGRPTPFDALEFNEEMASTDVIYDIAFIVMDMLERGLRDQANAFLCRYLSATRDYSGLGLLPLFISMRAAVRALVAASRKEPDPHEPGAGERLAFAIRALRDQAKPRLIAIGGLSGSGKSTIARRAAPQIGRGIGAVVLRSDVARKHMFGVSPEDRLPEDAYGPGTTELVYTRLLRDAGRVLRQGFPAVVDATFLSPFEREQVRLAARRAGVPFCPIWMDCGPKTLRARISARTGDASDADVGVLEKQLALRAEAGDWTRVPADGSVEDTAALALAAIRSGSD